MPATPNHEAFQFAECILAWQKRRLPDCGKPRAGLSKHGLARDAGLSREYIGRLERGVANPTIPVTAQRSHDIGMPLTEFVEQLGNNAKQIVRETKTSR